MHDNTYLRLPVRHTIEKLRCYTLYIKTTDETYDVLLSEIKEKIQTSNYNLYQNKYCQPEKRLLNNHDLSCIRTGGNVYLFNNKEELFTLLTK